ncbi:MAG TPA: DNA repair protein RecO [Gemmatimonadaceae bacterium]|jgi:DNA repair protein RecO (recombination protein O)
MPLLATEAIVLHTFDYLESSRILRLVTREGGVRSVLARGARRSSRRFGSALDLFAQGSAQLHVKPGRDLDTLGNFEVERARPALALELERFTGAAVIAELTLRFGRDVADPELFDATSSSLDELASASANDAPGATLAGAWRIIAALGFAPGVDECNECHASFAPNDAALFSHPAGGTLCDRCARLAPSGRRLPAAARAALGAWISGQRATLGGDADVKAHQRLLREFLREHLADERPLRAFEMWEQDPLSAPQLVADPTP